MSTDLTSSFKLWPAEKTGPLADRTTQLSSEFWLAFSIAVDNSFIIGKDKAFLYNNI